MGKYAVLILLAIWSIFVGCAKVMPLTGGDEDKDPPQFRSSTPDTFTVNFKGKSIVIKFDEYINLVDPTREILISPPVYPVPEFILNGQSVKIKFKDSLQPNITYVIQFGKSIQDITEANTNTGFSFVFSTGSFLDSGEVKGNITDAYTGKPSEGYKVMLYKTDVSDSFPYKDKPFYLAYTDATGNFRLGNLRKGNYKIFALLEDNNNYIYDRGGEVIAYTANTVSTSDSVSLKLVSFIEEGGQIKFNKAKSVSSVKTEFYFSGIANEVKISPYFGFNDSSYFAYELNTAKDTLTMWHNPIQADSFGVFIKYLDLSDTVVLRTNRGASQASSGSGRRNKNVANNSMSLDAASKTNFDLYTAPTFTFSEPIKNFDTTRIKLLADSVLVNFNLLLDSISPRKYAVLFDRLPKKRYSIICDSAAFISISGKPSAKVTYTFGFREAAEYGAVKIIYEDSIIKFPKIWHLLKDDKVIRETFATANQNEMQFSRLEPGSYKLRLILDANGNQKWDSGKYMEGKQPEKVLYMTEAIELKSGWDSEIVWKKAKPRPRGR